MFFDYGADEAGNFYVSAPHVGVPAHSTKIHCNYLTQKAEYQQGLQGEVSENNRNTTSDQSREGKRESSLPALCGVPDVSTLMKRGGSGESTELNTKSIPEKQN